MAALTACFSRALARPVALLCAALTALALAVPAPATAGLSYLTKLSGSSTPSGNFEDACGVALDSHGDLYVADYHHHAIDVFGPGGGYLTQIAGEDPSNGPCGLAVDSAGRLYVNNWRQDVVRYTPSSYPPSAATTYGSGTAIDASGTATGVAIDPASDDVYVDDGPYVAVYEPSGAPLEVGGAPLRIGLGSLGEGYGVAVSAYSATPGYVYVPDAADRTVKVYDPAHDPLHPALVIDGAGTPQGGFADLLDAAVAVDPADGHVFVSDDIGHGLSEHPEAAIDELDQSGAFLDQVPHWALMEGQPPSLVDHWVVDAEPSGLAVGPGSELYVTNGNDEGAEVDAFGPAAPAAPAAASGGASTAAPGTAAASSRPRSGAGGTPATVTQKGNLLVASTATMKPSSLPRDGTAPVAVSIAGHVSTTDGSPPPQLRKLSIEINRHGHLDYEGLASCPLDRIQPGSSRRALAVCRAALIGHGRFWANIKLRGQPPYPTQGRLLVFNGKEGNHQVLLAQIYATKPFLTSFVLSFAIRPIAHGTYGTALVSNLPRALGGWGDLTGIEMTLSRRWRSGGKSHSYLSAGCPAPRGFPGVVFSLARTSFTFAERGSVAQTLRQSCRTR